MIGLLINLNLLVGCLTEPLSSPFSLFDCSNQIRKFNSMSYYACLIMQHLRGLIDQLIIDGRCLSVCVR